MKVHPITVDLPDEVAVEVGKIMVHWSYVLWLLQHTTYKLLGVGPKQGRVAVRDPRPEEYPAMIEQLMGLAKIEIDAIPSKMTEGLRELKTVRDILAHGVWVLDKDTGQLGVSITGGSWRPDPSQPKVSRRIMPEGKAVTPEGLRQIRTGMALMIVQAKDLHDKVSAAVNAKSPG